MRAPAVAVVVLAVACGGGKPAPVAPPSNKPAAEPTPRAKPEESVAWPRGRTPTDRDLEALMTRAVAIFTAMGAVADQHPKDCSKLADGLDRVMDDNRAFFAEARQWKDDPDMTRRAEEWFKVHQDELMAPMMKVATAGQQCASDPKFQRTMERLGKLGD